MISYVGCAYVVLSWFVFLVSCTYLIDSSELQVSPPVCMQNDGVCLGNSRFAKWVRKISATGFLDGELRVIIGALELEMGGEMYRLA